MASGEKKARRCRFTTRPCVGLEYGLCDLGVCQRAPTEWPPSHTRIEQQKQTCGRAHLHVDGPVRLDLAGAARQRGELDTGGAQELGNGNT